MRLINVVLTAVALLVGRAAGQTSASAHNLTYVIDYTFLDNSFPNMTSYFKDILLAEALSRMSGLVQVRNSSAIPAFTTVNGCFNDNLIPTQYLQQSTNTDLLIFPIFWSSYTRPVTGSTICVRDSTGRPTVAVLHCNMVNLALNFNNTVFMVRMLQRELIRVLVFHPVTFGYFPGGASATYSPSTRTTPAGTVSGYKLITASVLGWAKIYFNCATMDGVFLEDEADFLGGKAFWESTVLGFELMTINPPHDAPLTMFTLMVFKDSGWYNVDTSQAEQIDFGRLAGCTFFDISLCAPASPEFCVTQGLNSCSRSHVFRTTCQLTPYSNGCIIGIPIGNARCASQPSTFQFLYDDETPGPLAKCHATVVGSVPSAACMTTLCFINGTMTVNFTQSNYQCTEEGLNIAISPNMNLACPNFRRTCIDANCPGQCYGAGICRENGQCTCDYFFSGSACQNFGGCAANASNICSAIVPNISASFPLIQGQAFNLTGAAGVLPRVLAALLALSLSLLA